VAGEIGHPDITHCQCFMVGDGIHLQSLGEVVHANRKISIPTFALWEQSCNVDGDPLRWCTDIILVHQAPAPGLGALAF
jgi:hypothetical protein